jgi:baculoviral IAP repeat-containing protein 2/3
MSDDSSTKDHPKNDPSKAVEKKTQQSSSQNTRLHTSLREIRETFSSLTYRPGVHTVNHLRAAGFTYTGDGDTARCDDCGLQVSSWTDDMVPFTIHSQRNPHCPFIRSIRSSSSPTIAVDHRSVSNEQENPSTRQSIETTDSESLSNTLIESDLLQQVRRRTFSHWSGHNTLPRTHMIEAGFFHCNVGDRVICIYCNLICQHWTPNVDDPCEVHRTLSPNCIYAKAFLTLRGPRCIINSNGNSIRATGVRPSFASNNINSLSVSGSVRPAAENNNRNAIRNGSSSSSTVPYGKVRSVDNIIQANYFNTDTKTIDTCPSCNGSLQIWGSKDHPMIEHARWFPHCPYVQQLRGTEMFLRIQASNPAQRGMFEHYQF